MAQPAGRPRRAGRVAHLLITQQHQLAMGDGAATVDAGVLETAVERAGPVRPAPGANAEVPAGDDAHLPAVVTRARPPPPRSTPSPCRWTRWRPAACTTRWEAASTATRSTRLLAGAALREDALRPGAAAASTCTDGRSPARRYRASPRRSSPTCCATRHPEGGFFSAEDADSEGIEGKFYCWSVDELREAVTTPTR